MTPLILASQSPRRKQILEQYRLPFEQCSHSFDERSIPWSGKSHDYVKELAREKALDVSSRFPDRTVIGADTIVELDGELLTKPSDAEDAVKMISKLSGKKHNVVTGIAIFYNGQTFLDSDETRVHIQNLTETQIRNYLKLKEWHDKVGGYAIQGAGALLVERIEGCYYNVIGLPVICLARLLKKINIDLWDYLWSTTPS
jgi:septum formation protein